MDLGFSERGANHLCSGSLKQGVWGVQTPRSYRVLKFCEKELTKIVPRGVVGATLERHRLLCTKGVFLCVFITTHPSFCMS